ncbi:hypothetical protein [Polaribacter sp. P097]|uniref:hypothetical protein n=1 Tax=Polaribacter sp. P097 TaxID=3117398 RepID=UPI002FE329FC
MSTENKSKESKEELNTDLYKDVKTDDTTSHVVGKPDIHTEETKILKSKNSNDGKEILIGKDIEEIEKIEADHESLQRKILNKLS